MATYIAVTVLAIPFDDKKPDNTYLAKPGDEVEFSGEVAEKMLKLGAIKEPEEDEAGEGSDVEEDEDLPERPSNSATKEEWRSYLAQLAVATGEPIPVADDAKRDDMIKLGDERVATWNEG